MQSEFISLDSIKHIYNHLPKQSKTGFMGKRVFRQIEYLESETDLKANEEVPPETSLTGSSAPDFTGKDLSGKTVRLSDFKDNSFVLLDFWASWCAPCIAQCSGSIQFRRNKSTVFQSRSPNGINGLS